MSGYIRALAAIDDRASEEDDAAMIVAAAATDQRCRASLKRFLGVLAAFCGDMALAYGARGGVFIGGGMTPRLRRFLDPDEFRAQFEAKADMRFYVQSIPLRLIIDPDAALLGAARMLEAV